MIIKVYSTQSCPYCVTLKEFLKANNIEFENVDVSFDQKLQQEMIDKSEQMGVPVVDIDGQIVVGFDRERIVQLLNLQ
ncbi:MAG: glutaredoxin domain-containing protein [bacterium]|nr:glutaredoxin domain-containing protein [bacterium]